MSINSRKLNPFNRGQLLLSFWLFFIAALSVIQLSTLRLESITSDVSFDNAVLLAFTRPQANQSIQVDEVEMNAMDDYMVKPPAYRSSVGKLRPSFTSLPKMANVTSVLRAVQKAMPSSFIESDRQHIGSSLPVENKLHGINLKSSENKSSKMSTLPSVLPLKHPQPSGKAKSPFAYAFLLTGCDPDDPWYVGFLYGVMVAVEALKTSGSQADYVLMIRMAQNVSMDQLPQEAWLRKMGVRTMYLPRVPHLTTVAAESSEFNEAQMLKFHVLHLIDYQRVLYLDSDIMPLCNIDYIFELSMSDNPYLMENLVVFWTEEPANGGFFMLKPGEGEYEQLLQIIERQREEGKKLAYPHFDGIKGWGHAIQPDDQWVGRKRWGKMWDFYAVYNDQGLLYHWVKYVKKNVVTVRIKVSEWFGSDENGKLVKKRRKGKALDGHSCLPRNLKVREMRFAHHPSYLGNLARSVPFGDYIHFYGHFKPWFLDYAEPDVEGKMHATSATSYWFFLLRRLNEKLSMGVDFESWRNHTESMRKYQDHRVASLQDLLDEYNRKNNRTN